jgi:hypothetical protein
MKPDRLQFSQRIGWAVIVALMVACSWLPQIDAAANQLVDSGMKRALLSFASARVLNGVISVAQGTEVALQPGGMGVILSLGQVLDPVNDLVEQFSNLMLIASVSFGAQKMLMSIGGNWVVSLGLTITAAAWIFFYLRRLYTPAWLSRVLVILLMIRFALPVITIGTDMLFQKFMAADYHANQQSISVASEQLNELTPPQQITKENPGVIKKFQNWWGEKSSQLDVKSRFDQLKLAAENATQHIVNLIVIFLLQTLVIPLLILWMLYSIARRVFERPARITIENPSGNR